ncbi:hypothetical protein BKA70DRAFT_595944 [Coprinopsis sp. MPI-PUGE-AT-0042]|nr:hypothetical protein BKA70DRAFT_595944 [Coprinopsis sp. MPI-PUGE-AT-0042]
MLTHLARPASPQPRETVNLCHPHLLTIRSHTSNRRLPSPRNLMNCGHGGGRAPILPAKAFLQTIINKQKPLPLKTSVKGWRSCASGKRRRKYPPRRLKFILSKCHLIAITPSTALFPPTPRSNDHGPHVIPSVIDVTPPASPARRHHAGDPSKVARQMGGVPHVQSGSENTPTVMQGDHSPRPVDGLLTPTPHSTPWRNSLTSDRSVSPMSFSPPTPIQRTASTPIDSQGGDYPPPPTPHARSTAFSSNTQASSSETGSSIVSEVNEHPSSASPNAQIDLGEQSDSESATLHTDSDGHETIHEDDKYPAASLKSPANESEIHYTRPRTPFGEYLLSDEKRHAQPAEVSFRWLHDLGQDEEGVIVIVREAVTDIWSGEWNIALHDVISAIRFL